MIAALLSLVLATCAATLAPQYRKESTDHATTLRAALLASYDAHVPPKSDRSEYGTSGTFTQAGTDVRLQVKYFKVQTVVPQTGSMMIKSWVRMYWKDERLAWNPTDYGGLEYIFMWGDPSLGSGSTEIWVPDVQPYNANHGITITLEPAYAKVSSDGTVFFSRPGSLDIMCKFSGLTRFPYDRLKCPIDWGGWALSGMQQGIVLHDGGFVNGYENEFAAGSSYQEHSIIDVAVNLREATYNASHDGEPWPLISYVVTLERAHLFYTQVVILPTILITLLSFAVFWSDPSTVDALGYGVNIIIVVVLMQVVVITYLPVCGEMLWIDLFLITNTIFCISTLGMSILCMVIEFNNGPGILTACLMPLEVVRSTYKANKEVEDKPALPSDDQVNVSFLAKETVSIKESVAGLLYRKLARENSAKVDDGSQVLMKQLSREQQNDGETTARGRARGRASLMGADGTPAPIKPRNLDDDALPKLAFFESLFFILDLDSRGELGKEAVCGFLSFAAPGVLPEKRELIFAQYDTMCDRQLSRMEFCRLCRDYLWDHPLSQIELAVKNFHAADEAESKRKAATQKAISVKVESWARVIIPTLYACAMAIIFVMDFDDSYDDANDIQEMFWGSSGIRVSIVSGRIYVIIIIGVALLAAVAAWILKTRVMRSEEQKKKRKEQETLKLAGLKVLSQSFAGGLTLSRDQESVQA